VKKRRKKKDEGEDEFESAFLALLIYMIAMGRYRSTYVISTVSGIDV
jgi:hypothetical protein